ncbi:hypothetical protein BpHYR1_052058 [Brachionus plicatilis]|uniref:Uncharacterized protein n=1 Tax=Brachionus plicatilis TaxID=10195 RepID=A0A3M7Q2K3_BRAPC|nr:hypothetical protein BpHYR1_052058 [Brachionus plicatilis]
MKNSSLIDNIFCRYKKCKKFCQNMLFLLNLKSFKFLIDRKNKIILVLMNDYKSYEFELNNLISLKF